MSLESKSCQFFALIFFLPFMPGVCFTKPKQNKSVCFFWLHLWLLCVVLLGWSKRANLIDSTQCVAENVISVRQCDNTVPPSPAAQIGGNCLSFGSGKRDPGSSQMSCLCLSETEEWWNAISRMSGHPSGSICSRQGYCLHLSQRHMSQAAVYCNINWLWGYRLAC